MLPIMAAVAVRKKVVSVVHSSLGFSLQSLQFYLFVRSNQEQLYVLKNRTEPNELDELQYSKLLNQTTSYAHWHISWNQKKLIATENDKEKRSWVWNKVLIMHIGYSPLVSWWVISD